MDTAVYLLLMFIEVIVPSPPGTGFIIDQVNDFISDETNTPILYAD